MSKLIQAIKKKTNITYTENSALTYKDTGSYVLDFYYHTPARRGKDNTSLFSKALSEDELLALKALFHVRDVRGGQGERQSFRDCLTYLWINEYSLFEKIFQLVPFYGRWDDILSYVEDENVVAFVNKQLKSDLDSDKPSLLAKWMPSINTSSKDTVKLGKEWARALLLTEKEYRKMLSFLRSKLNVVEIPMSFNDWGEIEYNKVPSKASLLYRNAFKKHDAFRYSEYIQKVTDGKEKIHSDVLYPYELVEKCWIGQWDQTVEALWRNLPNYGKTDKNALVVADTSGSMSGKPITVCIALAIYLAERNEGIFHNKFITFSAKPELQDVVGRNLKERVSNLSHAHWDGNTNLQGVFDLILNTAVKNELPEDEMPSHIFIVSDMEFDNACGYRTPKTNLDTIKEKYEEAGYEMPILVFWNVDSRHNQVPATADEKRGVFLVSGCSPSIFQNAINAGMVTPHELMIEVLNSKRYDLVEKAYNV